MTTSEAEQNQLEAVRTKNPILFAESMRALILGYERGSADHDYWLFINDTMRDAVCSWRMTRVKRQRVRK